MGLAGRVVAEILTYCRGIILKMTANPHYPIADNPHNAILRLAVDELFAADQAAADGGSALKATLRQKRANVFNVMRPYRDFVNEGADGDEEILNTTGFELAKLPGSTTELQIPVDVRTKTLQNPGEVEIYCKKVKGATGYQVRHRPVSVLKPPDPMNPNPSPVVENQCIPEDPLGPTRQTIAGLQSAMYHEFQMRAIGAGRPSPWSGTVNGLAA